ncbi:MAG: transposase [Terracidiphilus sp.]
MKQIVGVLKQSEVVPVAELIRKTGIIEQTYYRWKAKYTRLEVDQVQQEASRREHEAETAGR